MKHCIFFLALCVATANAMEIDNALSGHMKKLQVSDASDGDTPMPQELCEASEYSFAGDDDGYFSPNEEQVCRKNKRAKSRKTKKGSKISKSAQSFLKDMDRQRSFPNPKKVRDSINTLARHDLIKMDQEYFESLVCEKLLSRSEKEIDRIKCNGHVDSFTRYSGRCNAGRIDCFSHGWKFEDLYAKIKDMSELFGASSEEKKKIKNMLSRIKLSEKNRLKKAIKIGIEFCVCEAIKKIKNNPDCFKDPDNECLQLASECCRNDCTAARLAILEKVEKMIQGIADKKTTNKTISSKSLFKSLFGI